MGTTRVRLWFRRDLYGLVTTAISHWFTTNYTEYLIDLIIDYLSLRVLDLGRVFFGNLCIFGYRKRFDNFQ